MRGLGSRWCRFEWAQASNRRWSKRCARDCRLSRRSVGAQGLPGIEECVAVADDASGLADVAVKLLRDDALWREASRLQLEYARGHFSRAAFRRSFLEAIGDQKAVAALGPAVGSL